MNDILEDIAKGWNPEALRGEIRALRAQLREAKRERNRAVSAHERHQRSVPVLESALKRLRAQLADSEHERDSARAIARVLAHAYETDNRPPLHMVREALTYPVRPAAAPKEE